MAPTAFESVCHEFRVAAQDKESPYTHMLLTGGKYNFSDEDLLKATPEKKRGANLINKQHFIDSYYATFQEYPTVSEFAYVVLFWWWQKQRHSSEGVSLVSKRSDPLFFMYFDLDIKIAEWDMSRWLIQQRSITAIVFTTVSSFYNSELEMTVAVTENPRKCVHNKDPTKASSVFHKVGIHIYFSNLVVNFEEAITLLHAVALRVRDVLGERNLLLGENAWSDVFDTSVYRNGLRDCATFKTNPCEKCQNQTNRDYDIDSLYMPKFLVCGGETIDVTPEFYDNPRYKFGEYNLVFHRLTRIRCSSKEAVLYRGEFRNMYPNGIGYIPSMPEDLVTSGRRSKEDPLQFPIDVAAQKKFRNFVLLYYSPEDLNRIECCVRENFDEARYGRVQIRNIYAFFWRDKDHVLDVMGRPCRFSKIRITLKGDGSRYCFNKGDHHRSNTAYFEVVLRSSSMLPRLEQRCWSPHSYKCHGVMRVCDRFRSGQIKLYGSLTKAVVALLFHNTHAQPDFPRTP